SMADTDHQSERVHRGLDATTEVVGQSTRRRDVDERTTGLLPHDGEPPLHERGQYRLRLAATSSSQDQDVSAGDNGFDGLALCGSEIEKAPVEGPAHLDGECGCHHQPL